MNVGRKRKEKGNTGSELERSNKQQMEAYLPAPRTSGIHNELPGTFAMVRSLVLDDWFSSRFTIVSFIYPMPVKDNR